LCPAFRFACRAIAQATAFTIREAAVTLEAEVAMPQPPVKLDLEVRHKNRREDTYQTSGDPQDFAWLERELRSWLQAHKWHPSRWREFELVARLAGRGDTYARVRA